MRVPIRPSARSESYISGNDVVVLINPVQPDVADEVLTGAFGTACASSGTVFDEDHRHFGRTLMMERSTCIGVDIR